MLLSALLARVNAGDAVAALPELLGLAQSQPGHPAVLTVLAEAYRLAGRTMEAVATYRQAGEAGAGARNWLAAGVLLAAERHVDEALVCLRRAYVDAPDSDEILDALITTLFNAGRQAQGIEFARRQLRLSVNPRYLSNAALLLQSNELHAESSAAFKTLIAVGGDDPVIAGSALVPARFTCEWSWIEALQARITACYAQGDYGAPQEYPLTHLTWHADERDNLEVTRAYLQRVVPPLPPVSGQGPLPAGGRRLRVGYLSCDFRNHATMHLMAGLFECHDRAAFEVFAYDYSAPDASEYRQRFLAAIEHHVDITGLGDVQAAQRIASDRLDILFDLKGYTGGARPGIIACRPAPLQAAYLGFPGSSASPDIDYIVSDRIVTPDASIPYYTEALCRLPHSYQCNDRQRSIAREHPVRSAHGLPAAGVVFGAFNQSYKIDRTSFQVWLRILAAVPDSVLWLLGQSEVAVDNLSREAAQAGIARERLVFAPFAPPEQHLARLQLIDVALDTLVCNGHTTTSDALWAGVPVVTARGRHFSSRVSESLLRAMALPELVGEDHDDMVRIAARLGNEPESRRQLREKLATHRQSAALFDSAGFTRNFEAAIRSMVERWQAGLPAACIDVEAPGGRETKGTGETPEAQLSVDYPACPLCAGVSAPLGLADCVRHPLWHAPLPRQLAWQRCTACGHVHTRHYWTPAGLQALFRQANESQVAGLSDRLGLGRAVWSPVVERVVRLFGGYAAFLARSERCRWLDVGCGDGSLVATAADYGFAAHGLDARLEVVRRMQALGLSAELGNLVESAPGEAFDVVSLMDVIEHLPYPRQALARVAALLRPGGLLVISTPDRSASTWVSMDAEGVNPYWQEIEHHHNFSREHLLSLLREGGFRVADFTLPQRYKSQMELYAFRD